MRSPDVSGLNACVDIVPEYEYNEPGGLYLNLIGDRHIMLRALPATAFTVIGDAVLTLLR
ncbi:hypothetical protein [Limnospira platensis]|uniref:hypothetical protein n=1 Tax=Limnospira platensis TaxID=118562 RepID=UPI003D6FCF6A